MKKLSKRHKLVVNMPYVLLHFLIQENVLELFCNNHVLDKDVHTLKVSIDSYIDCAFFWAKTPEGHNFWKHLRSKYHVYLSTLNII